MALTNTDTYEGWRKRGYQVRKGEKGTYDLKREVHLFHKSQVDVADCSDDADPDDAMEMWARGEWP